MSRWGIVCVLIVALSLLAVSVRTGGIEPQTEFSDHQKEPTPTRISGDKGVQIKKCIDTLFAPCFLVSQRKKAEKKLVELVSSYELQEGTVGDLIGCTWSSPLNFATPPQRHLIIVLFHCGGSNVGLSLWAVHESEEGAVVFRFEGHSSTSIMQGCGPWQVVNDLDGDGNPEIVVKHFLGGYDGAMTIAISTAIYRWDGKEYVRADEEYPDYYAQHVVPKYQKILAEHESWQNHEDETVRRLYRKCQFVLEKALSISRKSEPQS